MMAGRYQSGFATVTPYNIALLGRDRRRVIREPATEGWSMRRALLVHRSSHLELRTRYELPNDGTNGQPS